MILEFHKPCRSSFLPEKAENSGYMGRWARFAYKQREMIAFSKKNIIKCRLWAVQKLYNSQRGGMDKRMIKAWDRVKNRPMCGSNLFIQSWYKNENKSQEISYKTLRIPFQ